MNLTLILDSLFLCKTLIFPEKNLAAIQHDNLLLAYFSADGDENVKKKKILAP